MHLEITPNLTMAHGFFCFYSIYSETITLICTHGYSPDKIQHGTLTLITIISLLAADRLLDLMRRDLA